MDFTVRQAGRNDGDIIRLMLTAEYAQAGYSDEDIKALEKTLHHPDSMTEKIMAAINNPDLPTRCWLAIAGNRAAGIITTKDISGGVYVDPEFRRQESRYRVFAMKRRIGLPCWFWSGRY